MAILPRPPPAPMLRSGQGHGEEDAQRTSRHQDSEEQQGHPFQTDSDYNKHLPRKSHDVSRMGGRQGGREKDRQTEVFLAYVQEDEGGRDTPDEHGSDCEGVGSRRRGRRQPGEGTTAREGLNTQHFWSLANKAPESVHSRGSCSVGTGAGGRSGRLPKGASHLYAGGLLDQGYLG